MGNFDGVHLGHRAVIDAALRMGRAHGKPAFAVTFEPHPRSFFSPNSPQFRLTDETNKLRLLAGTGTRLPDWLDHLEVPPGRLDAFLAVFTRLRR